MTPERFEKSSGITAGTNPAEAVQPHITNEPYDKTSLDEAIINKDVELSVDTGQLHAVANDTYQHPRTAAEEVFSDSTTDVGWTPSGSETLTDTNEKKKRIPLAVKIGAAATGLGVALAAYLGSQNGGDNAPTPSPTTATAEAKPSTTAAPIETQVPSSEKPTSQTTPEVKTLYTVEQLKAMTPGEYNALPRAERLVLIQDMLKESKKVAAYYGDVYKSNPLDVASKDNTAQEIMNQIKYTIQLPLFQMESLAADDMRINKPNAHKALSAAFYDVSGEVTPLFSDMENKIQSTNTVLEVTDKYSNVKEVGPPQTTIDQQGKEIQYRTITFLSGEVNTHTAKVVFTETSNGKGIWQLYDFNDKA